MQLVLSIALTVDKGVSLELLLPSPDLPASSVSDIKLLLAQLHLLQILWFKYIQVVAKT